MILRYLNLCLQDDPLIHLESRFSSLEYTSSRIKSFCPLSPIEKSIGSCQYLLTTVRHSQQSCTWHQTKFKQKSWNTKGGEYSSTHLRIQSIGIDLFPACQRQNVVLVYWVSFIFTQENSSIIHGFYITCRVSLLLILLYIIIQSSGC